MKTHATLFVTLATFLVSTASTAFAAPPAAKVENVNGVSDGQRTIRIIAAPVRVSPGKPSLADRVLGRRSVPSDGGVARALPAADQPDANAEDAPDAGEGGVAATTVGGQIQVLGMELRYGPTGPVVPIRLDSKLQSDPDFVPRFGGADLKVYNAENPPNCSQNTPSTCDGIETVALGGSTGLLVFRARAAFDPDNADHDNDPWTGADFHREVLSDSANSLVLIDGDDIDDLITQKGIHPPYGNQVPIKDFLAPYIDSQGKVYLDPNRILILFELGTTNTGSAAYDFQDLVIALDLNGIVQAPDVVFDSIFPNEKATGVPDPTYPKDEFGWSMVRAAPGGSRIKGLAYERTQRASSTSGTLSIKACIAATGTNPSWTNCTLGTVNSVALGTGSYGNTVDMAMNDNGFHGVGWVDYNSSTTLVKYLVSFTKDNGATWDTKPPIGSFKGLTADDIDLASNEAGSIGVLAYYRQATGADPTEPDSLVLYSYNMNVDPTLGNPVKTVIVAGDGVQFASGGCTGSCFALTGDTNDTLHAFYYQGGAAKVTSVTNASTTPSSVERTITSNSLVTQLGAGSTCNAPSDKAGAAVAISGGTGNGLWDVPLSGNITRRTSTSFSPYMDDSVYTMALARSSTFVGGPTVTLYRMSSTGQLTNGTISDTLPYPYCGTAPTPPPTGDGTPCALFKGNDTPPLSYGATVIGNVHYSSSFRQDQAWSTVAGLYLATVEHIVIHQTSAEP
jgi:hypothetical protein